MNTQKIDNSTIFEAVKKIKEAILSSQYQAAKGVNVVQLSLYYAIGKYVSDNSRIGHWGSGAIESISRQLHQDLPGLRGFSYENLLKMRSFYERWRVSLNQSPVATDLEINPKALVVAFQSPVATDFPREEFLSISFSHHMEIIRKVDDTDECFYYIRQAYINHWSKYELREHLKWDDYHHQSTIPSNFGSTMTSATAVKALATFKDEYFLDFINAEDIEETSAIVVNERVVEQRIVQNIKKFIMAFGRKFCFIGNQYHLTAAGHDFYIDLLFFNRELNCLVAIELKKGEFKPPYLGELQTYLRLLDEQEKQATENPSVGIILCKEADKNFVELVIQDYNKPMGVATYHTSSDMPEHLRKALPNIEEMKKLM